MANGDTFDVIKDILGKDTLDDIDAHRLLLAGISDLKELIETKEDERREREKAQKKINDKVSTMYPVYQINIWMLAVFGVSLIGLIVSLITGQASITFN
jgi:hypothetical protein